MPCRFAVLPSSARGALYLPFAAAWALAGVGISHPVAAATTATATTPMNRIFMLVSLRSHLESRGRKLLKCRRPGDPPARLRPTGAVWHAPNYPEVGRNLVQITRVKIRASVLTWMRAADLRPAGGCRNRALPAGRWPASADRATGPATP